MTPQFEFGFNLLANYTYIYTTQNLQVRDGSTSQALHTCNSWRFMW